MADTYDTPLDELPPITQALRECWPDKQSPFGCPVTPEPTPTTHALRGVLAAVHALEVRLATLEGDG